MKKVLKSLIAMMLTVIMAVSITPVAFAAASGGSGFAFAATDSNGFVIEPCYISYENGQTIKEALMASGHTLTGIEDDWVYSINGHDDNYNRYYDGGQYDLSEPASSVETAMIFTVNEYADTDGVLKLVSLMAEYKQKPTEVKNFRAVKAAYNEAFDKLPIADAAAASKLAADFESAYQQYDQWQNKDRASVTVNAIKGDSTVNANVALIDQSGNEYRSEGESCSFELLPETYDFEVTSGNSEVTGIFTVEENEGSKVIDALLPDGNWFGNITLADTDKVMADCVTEGDVTTAILQDTTYSPYINVTRGAQLPDGALLYADYTGFSNGTYYGDESNNSYKKSWESSSAKLVQAVPAGLEGTQIKLKAIAKDPESGYTQRMYHTIDIEKVPTIKALTVKAGRSKLMLDPEFSVRTKEYQIETIADSIEISAQSYVYNSDKLASCGKFSEGYSIEIGGQAQEEDSSVNVSVDEGDIIPVTVIGSNGKSSDYFIKVGKLQAGNVKVTKPQADVAVTLVTSTGSEIEPDQETDSEALFNVAPGTYKWVTTLEGYYHASGSVTLNKDSSETVEAEGVMPIKEQLLADLGAFSGSNSTAIQYEEADGEEFNWQKHEYKYIVNDFVSTFYAKASYSSGVTVKRGEYKGYDGSKINAANLSNSTKTILSKFVTKGGRNNSVTITASRQAGGVTYYQDYVISTKRNATIESLSVSDEADNVYVLEQDIPDGDAEFDADVKNYVMSIGETAESVILTAGFSCPGDEIESTGDYTITIGEKTYKKSQSDKTVTQVVGLDSSKPEETIEIKAQGDDPENGISVYRITIKKVPPVTIQFKLNADNGNVYLIDELSGREVPASEDGSFRLMQNFKYTYVATAYGYVGVKESFRASDSQTVTVNLKPAQANPDIDTSINAEWPYFRADSNNNGVVDVLTPIKPEDTTLFWATQIGEGYSGNATGCPIMADGYIYTYSAKTIYKLDPVTGRILATGDMVRGSSFAINSPTYAEGMIFVGLSNGCVQAFNAKTLESVWVYKDILGGQPNCQITYENGYIYTGFWNSETKEANFVCLSVTDEDPSKTDEEKLATWVHTGAGYYWAGAFASDKFVIVGTDDGMSGYSDGCGTLLSMDPYTGRVLDSIEDEITGDIRSSICFDTETNKYYFTSKDGLFCSFKVNEDGTFKSGSLTKLQLYATSGKKGMSTSTPVIKNGRAYVGVSGVGQFTMYSGHNITVLDLTGSAPKIAYTVETQGYPQTSGLLTTAYGEDDGTVYVYFFDNFTPGKLRVIKDKPGQTAPDEETLETESYESSGNIINITTAKALFTPFGEHAQYAICSPIVDEWGNIYFKNDSAYMMMIGSTITKLEVTKKPDKLTYKPGEIFDPEGMVVTATYSNGKVRDVTKYVAFTDEPLTEEDGEIDIIFDLGSNMAMYQNVDGTPGVDYIPPQTSVSVTVKAEEENKIDVAEELVKVRVKKSSQIHATGCGKITYSSANSKIATVRSSGLVKGVKIGKTEIIIKASGDETHPEAEVRIPVTVPTVVTKAALSKTSFTYTGEEQFPYVKTVNKKNLVEGTDYVVERLTSGIEGGTHKIKVTGINDYDGSVTVSYKINAAKNVINAEFSSEEVIAGGELVELTASAKGGNKLTYKVTSGSKYGKIVREDGRVFIQGIKPGKVTVTITAAANKNCKKATKKVSIMVN